MQLEITKELLKYTCGYTPQLDVNEKYPLGMKVIYMPTAYPFDTDTYLLFVKDSDEAEYLTDTIPFPIVKQHEAMHAYVDSINNKRIKNPVSKNDWLTRDPMIVQLYDGDLWCGFTPTVSFFCDLFRGVRRVVRKKAISNIMATLPIYMIYGEEDPTGMYGKGPHTLVSMYKKAGIKDVEEKHYPGARHELLNELCREEVENDILSWLNRH